MAKLHPAVLLAVLLGAAVAEDVVTLTTSNFDQHLKSNKQTLVEFYAPWCGHCKKLAPEYEKAAGQLKAKGISLAKVDATEEKDLGSRYDVKGYPTLLWFEGGVKTEYDGGRNAEGIVEWVTSMTGPAVKEVAELPAAGEKPRVSLHAPSLLPSFEEAAKGGRRKALWFFVKSAGEKKVVVAHKGEEQLVLTEGVEDKDAVSKFVSDNELPLFGKLDGETFEKYTTSGRGLIWSLFPMQGSLDEVATQHRPMMAKVAESVKGRYFVTYTDTDQFKDAIDNMLSVKTFPAIAVQKKAGDKKRYIYDGEMTAEKIQAFIKDVDAGKVEPRLKSEPEPAKNDEPVKVVVGSTLQRDVFTADKDVLLEVYAPWCGHCKKLEPEYNKLAKKIQKEGLDDLITIAKLDGTANDSTVDSIDWSGFPTIFFVKAGTSTPIPYDGERTAKGFWKYLKKNASKAAEIRERLEKKKSEKKKAEEL